MTNVCLIRCYLFYIYTFHSSTINKTIEPHRAKGFSFRYWCNLVGENEGKYELCYDKGIIAWGKKIPAPLPPNFDHWPPAE